MDDNIIGPENDDEIRAAIPVLNANVDGVTYLFQALKDAGALTQSASDNAVVGLQRKLVNGGKAILKKDASKLDGLVKLAGLPPLATGLPLGNSLGSSPVPFSSPPSFGGAGLGGVELIGTGSTTTDGQHTSGSVATIGGMGDLPPPDPPIAGCAPCYALETMRSDGGAGGQIISWLDHLDSTQVLQGLTLVSATPTQCIAGQRIASICIAGGMGQGICLPCFTWIRKGLFPGPKLQAGADCVTLVTDVDRLLNDPNITILGWYANISDARAAMQSYNSTSPPNLGSTVQVDPKTCQPIGTIGNGTGNGTGTGDCNCPPPVCPPPIVQCPPPPAITVNVAGTTVDVTEQLSQSQSQSQSQQQEQRQRQLVKDTQVDSLIDLVLTLIQQCQSGTTDPQIINEINLTVSQIQSQSQSQEQTIKRRRHRHRLGQDNPIVPGEMPVHWDQPGAFWFGGMDNGYRDAVLQFGGMDYLIGSHDGIEMVKRLGEEWDKWDVSETYPQDKLPIEELH